MSELIGPANEKYVRLYQFAHRLIDGENGKMLIESYRDVIDSVDATETMKVFDQLLCEGYEAEKVKAYAGKIMNVIYKSLNAYKWEKPKDGHFLYYLMQENREVERLIEEIRPCIKMFLKTGEPPAEDAIRQLRAFNLAVKEYALHYSKKENILFPFLEKTIDQHRCLQIMWSFHDDFRRCVGVLDEILQSAGPDTALINRELGKMFFTILPVIFREEQIVFPVALRAIPEKGWNEMLEQSREIGWCFGINPVYQTAWEEKPVFEGLVDLGTGFLSAAQLMLMLDNLPVDITFVDENNEVRYFSGTKHRIFQRSKAIIGRKVQNCHPPESVHVVNQIIDAFRNGRQNHADFRIEIKGRFVHIRYFALHDEHGIYKGTIEVSQDITDMRAFQGQQRLLDWK